MVRNMVLGTLLACFVMTASQSLRADPSAAPPSPNASGNSNASTSTAAPPDSAGHPLAHKTVQGCLSFLPTGMKVPSGSAATLITYTITTAGEFRDATLFRSSGNVDLDKAALLCVTQGGHGEPTIVAGRPTDATWVGGVFWDLGSPLFTEANPDGGQNLFPMSYPHAIIRRNFDGKTSVSYHIGLDGSVKDVVVTQSSGNDSLDQTTIDNVERRKYYPVLHNGQPVEVDRTLTMVWRFRV
jgi:TonB family protein